MAEFLITKLNRSQSGVVSVYVSLVVVIILFLLAFSFASMSARDHAQVHEEIFNVQASYAAETAINDVRQELYKQILSSRSQAGNSAVNNIWSFGSSDGRCPKGKNVHPAWRDGKLTPDGKHGNVEYSCVVVDLSPTEVIFDTLDVDRSLVLPLQAADLKGNHLNLTNLIIGWDQASPVFTTSMTNIPSSVGSNLWLPAGEWKNPIPVLRLQVTIVNIDQKFTRQDLNKNTQVFYLYPSFNDDDSKYGSHQYPGESVLLIDGQRKKAQILDGNCIKDQSSLDSNLGFVCQASLTGMPHSGMISPTVKEVDDRLVYFVRLQSIYTPARIRVSGSVAGGSVDWGFKDIQAKVTATGRSGSVLERVEERMPLQPLYDRPEFALDSEETICKILANNANQGAYLHNSILQDLDPDGDFKKSSLPQSCWLRSDNPDWE